MKKILKFIIFIILVIIVQFLMDTILINIFNKTLSEMVRDFITNNILKYM